MFHTKAMRDGFSLLELSIVLVIIGLLAGGVMTGQSLIRAAEIRSTITDYTRFQTMLNAFRDKYQALPGDMKNATAFWGVAHATPATCRTTQGTGTQTCDGNGDGLIHTMDAYATYSERYRAWQQLANAGLIEGSYTGIGNGCPSCAATGVNIPAAHISNFGYEIIVVDYAVSGNVNWFSTPVTNLIWLNGASTAPFTQSELWNIDTKLDDGKPAYGMITAFKGSAPWGAGCSTTDVASTAAYDLAANTKLCWPNLILK